MVRVVNRHKYDGPGEYVGRGTPLGNPFLIGRDGPRAVVIVRYEQWLRQQWRVGGPAKVELRRLAALYAERRELTLICSCSPLPCHADVVARAVGKIVAAGGAL